MSDSKHRLEKQDIIRLASNAFGNKAVTDITELTAGECNALYLLTFDDGTRSVLKISSDGHGLTRNERWLMRSETTALKMLTDVIKVPRILYYDDSHTLCSGSYFFMEYIDGSSMLELRNTTEYDAVDRQLGGMLRHVTDIKNDRFGILGCDIRFDNIFDLVMFMINNNFDDIEAAKGDAGVSRAEVTAALLRDRDAFLEVKTASLIHYDLWENNVIVKDGDIAAVIDWERALWAEPLMERKIRDDDSGFIQGYGRWEHTYCEQIRMEWYGILVRLSIIAEGYFRYGGTDARSARSRQKLIEKFKNC